MTKKSVLITGASGGIGSALVAAYADAGWRVIATDLSEGGDTIDATYIAADLYAIGTDDAALARFAADVRDALGGGALNALVNNGAAQILGSVGDVALDDWQRTMAINLSAPFRLAQAFLPELRAASGTIVNMGSVHAKATKREFVAYATSKAAIHGLTRAMAVDLGASPRIVCVAPAAVATPMLEAGFEGRPDARAALEKAHPVGRIAAPSEIARAIVSLSDEPFLFSTGSIFWLDGGVLSRLYDPA